MTGNECLVTFFTYKQNNLMLILHDEFPLAITLVAHGVAVIVVGSGHDNPSSNLGQGCSHFTWANAFWNGMNPTVLIPVRGKL